MRSKLRLLIVVNVLAGALATAAVAGASGTAVLFADTGLGSSPTALAVDGSGSVFVLRSSPTAIAKVTSAGTLTSAWATASGSNSWNRVLIGPGNAIYASSDAGSNPLIQRFNADGTVAQNYTTYESGFADRPTGMAIDASGTIFYIAVSPSRVNNIDSAGVAGMPVPLAFQPYSIAVDAAGNVYVAGRDNSSGQSKLVRYSNDLSTSHDYQVDYGSANGCFLTAGPQYVYCAYGLSGGGAPARVSRIDGLTFDTSWATISLAGSFGVEPKALQVGTDGFLYVASGVNTQTGQTGLVSKISPAGVASDLATTPWVPRGIALDASTNVYISGSPMGGPNAGASGVYKIAQAAPTPDPTPDPTPEPGPPAKTSSIPSQISIASAAKPEVRVPCEAADGELLSECTVQITAPRSALAGIGGGIEVTDVRAAQRVTLGKATVKATAPRKRITVTVRLNADGKKALSRNVRVSGVIDLTAITQAATQSTGSKAVKLQLPRQVMTPTKGIFDTLSTTLNADGVRFVNRLAKVLPKRPKRIVCTGYADSFGVPGDNRWLGEQRARTLCDALAARGIKPRSTALVSRGADDPRASNATPAGRAENRRASITITY